MSDTIKQAGIKQADGTYLMKDIGVDYTNVDGLSTAAKSFEAFSADKATADKNNKDITEYVASISKNGENISVQSGDPTATPVDVDLSMTGATAVDNGEAGFVPQPTVADNAKFLKGDGTWAFPQDTAYTGSDNIKIDGTTNAIDLTDSTVSSGTYGPSADVTGSNGVTISVPKFTVDAKGRLTSAGTQTYTSVDTTYSAGTGLSLSGTSFRLGSHASTGTGYGQGSGSNFGHVKLSDTYASLVSGADAAGGVAASQNALYNAYNTLNGRLTQVQSQIVPTASIESGATASKAYNAGDFLVKDGILYKVINDIAEGDALTVGENIDSTTVVGELSEIKPSSTDKWTFKKLTATDNEVTVPSGAKEIYFGCLANNANNEFYNPVIIPIEIFNDDEITKFHSYTSAKINAYIMKTSTENVYSVHNIGGAYSILGYR